MGLFQAIFGKKREQPQPTGGIWQTLTGYTLHIHLREKTAVEALTERVDALEESQATQDGAIDDLGGAVSELMEG